MSLLRRPGSVAVIVAAVSSIVLAPACRRVTPSAAHAGAGEGRARVTACTLNSAEEVEARLGGPVSAPEATTDGGADALAGRSGCAWSTVDQRGAVLVELVRTSDMSVSVRRTGFSAEARFAATRSRYGGAITVPGLGTEAVWVDETATLYVLAGDSYLTLAVAVAVPSAAEDVATGLARLAIVHLGTTGNRAD